MSERNGFEPGVPCWVDTWQGEAAAGFYTELFGWELAQGDYSIFRLRGRDAAGLGGEAIEPVAWTTYVQVEDADRSAAAVTEAGGTLVREPFDSLDGGRIAIAADPQGGVIGLWQLGEHGGAQLVNEPGAWAISALSTPDLEGAKAFYGAVLGWETEPFGPATMFRLPGFVGGEPTQPVPRDVVAVMMEGETAQWTPDFWVHDAEATAAKAAEIGGRVLMPPSHTGVGTTGVLADPGGAVFSVTKIDVPS
jgi:uncharacterized protein